MSTERATKKQQVLLQFVDDFIREHGYGPSYREIMTALGYKSVSTVAAHIDGLTTKGYLQRRDSSPRSLEVVTRHTPDASPREAPSTVVSEISAKLTESVSDEHKTALFAALDILGYTEERQKLEEEHATPSA